VFKSLAYLVLLLVVSACAPKFTPSPHYAGVAKHLDVGGDVMLYADVDGDFSATADYLDKIIERVHKNYPELKVDRINAKRLLGKLGVDQVLAMGLSSSRDGKAFRNKAFFEFGKNRRGLLLLTSSPAHAMEIVQQAPGDVDIAFESDLKVKSLMDLVEGIAEDVGGKDGQKLFDGLKEKLPGTSLSVKQIIGQLDTRVVGILRVDYQRAFVAPGNEKTTVPGFDALFSVDNLAAVFDAYHGLLQALPNAKCSTEGDLQWVEFDAPIPGAAWLKPVLVKNAKSGRVFVASSKAFVKEYLSEKNRDKPPLAQAKDYRRATADFLPQANALTYVSSALMPKITRFVKPLGKDDKDARATFDIMLQLLPEGGIPFAAQQVNLPDGLYYASFAQASHKTTLFSALAVGPALVASVAASAVTRLLAHASREPEPAPFDFGGDKAPDAASAVIADAPAVDDTSDPNSTERFRIPLGGPSRGATQPLVNIVEFSDFQCPFCARVNPTLTQLLEKYPDDVRIYFRHNPLPFHSDAALAAQAARAAQEQNKFWLMHDLLFAHQESLKRTDLEAYATSAGLDKARFNRALDRGTYSKAIQDDAALAAQFDAAGTPAFFINGRKLVGAHPLERFSAIIDEEIAKAKELMAAGTKRRDVYTKLMATASKPKPHKD